MGKPVLTCFNRTSQKGHKTQTKVAISLQVSRQNIMKLVISSLSISSILAADFASIPYRLQDAANALSPIFLNDLSNFPTEIFDHGCWCGKLNALPSAGLGGKPVDDLDQLCKDWTKARRCSRLSGATCESASALTGNYQVEYDFAGGATGTQLCPDSNACLLETCQIDSYYINLIKAWRTANPGTFTPDSNPTCENHGVMTRFTREQFQTTARPIDQGAIDNALSDAGVDNTGKAIAVTLVWEGANRCDFDLVVTDPTGEKVYYGNELSSTGGSLDADQRGRYDLNVENISWNPTPPSGTYQIEHWAYRSCSQPDFTIYINVDGVLINTITGTSNGDEQVIGTFEYSSGSRNFFAQKYTGPAQVYGPKNN